MNKKYSVGDVVFSNWTLTRQIGEGSFGQVYEAERKDFGRTYKAAIKIVTIPQSQSEILSVQADGLDDESVTAYFRGFVEELVDEFALMSELKGHSNVVSYEDHTVLTHEGNIGWDILIRMELLTPLLQYVRTNTMTQRDVIQLGIDMCKALELCQKYKIIHRDIKPENIFISPVGDYKLGDFGIARTVEKTTSGLSKKGTYTYMAPEAYKDQPYGTTVDIYSLGIVLYWLLNESRSPFLPPYPSPITHSDREKALRARMDGTPLPPPKNADGRLAEIVLKACAYLPKDRYSSPMQMRQELEAILYARKDAPLIYPAGDEVPARSVREIPTDEPSVFTDRTESVFSVGKVAAAKAANKEPTVDKTESIFSPWDDAGLSETAEEAAAVFEPEEDSFSSHAPEKKKGSRAEGVIAALFLVALGIGGYFASRQQDSLSAPGTVTPSPSPAEVSEYAAPASPLPTAFVKPTDFELSREDITLLQGETWQLEPIYTPSNASGDIMWKSNDPSVAEVFFDGVVTAVAPGNTVITATIEGVGQKECIIRCQSASGDSEKVSTPPTSPPNIQAPSTPIPVPSQTAIIPTPAPIPVPTQEPVPTMQVLAENEAVVPDVVGMEVNEAVNLLGNIGLVALWWDDSSSTWYVIEQNLQPGIIVERGTAVSLTTSPTPPSQF